MLILQHVDDKLRQLHAEYHLREVRQLVYHLHNSRWYALQLGSVETRQVRGDSPKKFLVCALRPSEARFVIAPQTKSIWRECVTPRNTQECWLIARSNETLEYYNISIEGHSLHSSL
jgi:hypothetical protein